MSRYQGQVGSVKSLCSYGHHVARFEPVTKFNAVTLAVINIRGINAQSSSACHTNYVCDAEFKSVSKKSEGREGRKQETFIVGVHTKAVPRNGRGKTEKCQFISNLNHM